MNVQEDSFGGVDRRLDRFSLVIAIVGTLGLFFFHSLKSALSLAAGAGLSYINFRWLKQGADFIVSQGMQGGRAAGVGFRFVARYALIALFLYVTIRSSALELIFVFAGLLTYVAAILIEAVYEVVRAIEDQ